MVVGRTEEEVAVDAEITVWGNEKEGDVLTLVSGVGDQQRYPNCASPGSTT